MKYEVEKLAAENAIVGEGPVWAPDRQILYWTDIQGGKFWEYDPATGTNKQLHDGDFVAGVAVNAPDELGLVTVVLSIEPAGYDGSLQRRGHDRKHG